MHKLRWLVEMSQLEYKAMPIGWARRTVGPVKHLHLSMTATLAKSIALTRVILLPSFKYLNIGVEFHPSCIVNPFT